MSTRSRPLSPHLGIYRFMYTMATSIAHRITGIVLSAGLVVLVGWLFAAASGAERYAQASALLSTGFMKLLIAGWLLAFCYHLCNGIRHLFWDAGKGFELHQVYASGYTVLAAATTLTALTWGYVLFVAGGAA